MAIHRRTFDTRVPTHADLVDALRETIDHANDAIRDMGDVEDDLCETCLESNAGPLSLAINNLHDMITNLHLALEEQVGTGLCLFCGQTFIKGKEDAHPCGKRRAPAPQPQEAPPHGEPTR